MTRQGGERAAGTAGAAGAAGDGAAPKPTPEELGIAPAALAWERSGDGEGSIEVAFPVSPRWGRGDWVLVRVAGDRAGRVLVFDRNEWDCFIDGARNGEFDNAADLASVPGRRMSWLRVTSEPAASSLHNAAEKP